MRDVYFFGWLCVRYGVLIMLNLNSRSTMLLLQCVPFGVSIYVICS